MDRPAAIQAEGTELAEVDKELQRLDGRDWRLWVVTIFVMVAMASTIVVLALELRPHTIGLFSDLQLDTAVHALLAIILIFSIFLVYQQFIIRRLRRMLIMQAHVSARPCGTDGSH